MNATPPVAMSSQGTCLRVGVPRPRGSRPAARSRFSASRSPQCLAASSQRSLPVICAARDQSNADLGHDVELDQARCGSHVAVRLARDRHADQEARPGMVGGCQAVVEQGVGLSVMCAMAAASPV